MNTLPNMMYASFKVRQKVVLDELYMSYPSKLQTIYEICVLQRHICQRRHDTLFLEYEEKNFKINIVSAN